MIKTNFGRTEINGSIEMILTDLTSIVSSLNNFLIEKVGFDEEKAKDAIQHAYNIAFMDEEELERENEKLKQQIADKADGFPEVLAELFETLAEALKGGASE